MFSLKNVFRVAVLSTFFLVMPALSLAAEQIDSYHTDLHLTKDGVLHVTETIHYDFGAASKHGLERFIPTTAPDTATNWLFERYIEIKNIAVSRDGMPENYTVNSNGTIRIGNASVEISGVHTYLIQYDVFGALVNFTNGGQGIYWNAIGTEWIVPISKMSASVSADPGILSTDYHCSAGAFGATDSCLSTVSHGMYLFTTAQSVVGQGMTIQQRINPDTVVVLKTKRIKWQFVVGFAVCAGLAALIYSVRRILYKYRKNIPIVAQYEPYAGMTPMLTGYFYNGKQSLAGQYISSIIYLAQQGFLTLEESIDHTGNVDDLRFTLLKTGTGIPHLDMLLKFIFDDAPVGTVGTMSELHGGNPGGISTKFADVLSDELYTLGLYEKLPPTHMTKFVLGPVVLASALYAYYEGMPLIILPFAMLFFVVIPVGVALAICDRGLTDRMTSAGYDALAYLKGFALFLRVTDSERFTFHNAPEKRPESFMEYLPYAITLGVEKEWAALFADMTITMPDWYTSNSATVNNSMTVLNNLQPLTTAVMGRSIQSISSSRSVSSQSSSFGGGSVGGGAGGGGGRSW